MSKALEAAARALAGLDYNCLQKRVRDEFTREDYADANWVLFLPEACACVTAYLRAVGEDFSASWKVGEAIERAVEPETGRTDYGGPIPSPSPATKARAALAALEMGND